MNSLQDKIAIITGAARGIGRGIAFEMGRAGAKLVLVDIDPELLAETEHSCVQQGFACISYVLDVRDTTRHVELVQNVLSQFGRIDILVNNAGINAQGGLLDSSDSDTLAVISTNLIGPYFLTKRVTAEMISRNIEGVILFTSSTHSHITMMRPAYSASKAAIEMLVKDTALELSEHGIRVNAVAPGAIAVRGEENRYSEHVPLGYVGIPEDVGKAMVFLASTDASYITGQTLVVDGAFSLAHTHYWGKKGKL
jgi:NAD(P)-dependent dehydrogenase (short-subunit alcohol dehydrogenase family)